MSSTTIKDRLLTTDETSAIVGSSPSTLANHRSLGIGLPYVKIGRSVRYRESQVMAYLAELETIRPVGDEAA